MPRTYEAKAVTVEAEGLPSAILQITYLNIPHGARWGVARILFPAELGLDSLPTEGVACTIKIEGDVLLSGHVVTAPSTIADGEDEIAVDVADLRWEMTRVKVGMGGVGPLVEDFGGFPLVGYRVHFNPSGVGNRSKEVDQDGDGDTYTFEALATSEKWTLKQMLQFIVFWYYPDLVVDVDALSDAWDSVENDVNLYLLSMPAALSELAKRAGESWTLRYDGADVIYQPMGAAPTETVTLNLPDAGDDEPARSSSAYSALEATVVTSIIDSVDRVEIQSANILHETLYSNHGDDPLLISPTDEPPPPGYARMFRVDVTKYEAWKLGKNLPEGTRPKPWARQNVTRVTSANEFLDAEDADLLARWGRPMLPEDCCWVNFDQNETKYKLLSGISILFDEGVILIHNHVETSGGSFDFVEGAQPTMYLWITLTTQLELPFIYRPDAEDHHIDAQHEIVLPILRTDITPMTRFKSLMPDYSSSDLTQTVEFALLETEYYFQVTDDFKLVHDAYLAARGDKERIVHARLLDIPVIPLGARLQISPAHADLSGNEIVVDVSYDFANGDHVELMATNNLARLFLGDL